MLILIGPMKNHSDVRHCYLSFENLEQKEEHQYSTHGSDSWSCAADGGVEAAFDSLYPMALNPDYDICCYCGRLFSGLSLEECINHLIDIHNFGGCNENRDLFHGAAHFRRHLRERHGAVDGKWISALETVCVRPNTTSGALKTSLTFLSKVKQNISLGCATQ
jgi:hypothetical protein